MHYQGVQDRAAFYTYVQRKLENRSTLANASAKKDFFTQLYGSHRDFRKKNPFSINIKVGVYCYIIFFKRFGATYFVNFEQWMFRRIFYDFHYLNFLLEVMVKSTRRVWGHFVTLNYVKTPCLIT